MQEYKSDRLVVRYDPKIVFTLGTVSVSFRRYSISPGSHGSLYTARPLKRS